MKTTLFNSTRFMAALLAATGLASTVQAAGVSGAIFTTTVNGSAVNANQYDSKCDVYLNGGPGPHAPARAAGLPDGDYYFQVTDPNGSTLLSTDPVSNRRFSVSGGIVIAFTGTGGPAHPTGIDQDHAALGAITIRLANSSCPTDFLNSPNNGNVYKVWATPVSSFVGNAANVDNPCGTGCFHGFVPSQSKTDNFKATPAPTVTFCLTIQKQFFDGTTNFADTLGWGMNVTDPFGVTNHFTTDSTGQVTVCQLSSGTYTVVEDPTGATPLSSCVLTAFPYQTFVNGVAQSMPGTAAFTWNSTNPVTVLFVNSLGCIG
ncbi:MAG TPA: hypothetical protein VNX18_06520 [Bryobacteraceae bacterium]|nr:hypothetical protein [Bryobacteraceae bacterium]